MKLALIALCFCFCFCGASARSKNFIVSAPDQLQANEITRLAETYRKWIAETWLGAEMADWSRPCEVVCQIDNNYACGGGTSYIHDKGETFGFRMKVQGNYQALIESALPHEITHAIFASYYRQPLPRWLDEGAAGSVESVSEQTRLRNELINYLQTGRGIPFNNMFATIKDYPRDVHPLYSQGYSVSKFLIEKKDNATFVDYVGNGLQDHNWQRATKAIYDYEDLGKLQADWLKWVRAGNPTQMTAARVACGRGGCATRVASNYSGNEWRKAPPQQDWPKAPSTLVPVPPKPTTDCCNEVKALTERITQLEKEIREQSTIAPIPGEPGPAGAVGETGPAGAQGEKATAEEIETEIINILRRYPAHFRITDINGKTGDYTLRIGPDENGQSERLYLNLFSVPISKSTK